MEEFDGHRWAGTPSSRAERSRLVATLEPPLPPTSRSFKGAFLYIMWPLGIYLLAMEYKSPLIRS